LKLEINGEPATTDATTLNELCQSLGFDAEQKIATAVNGDFVPEAKRAACSLQEGDKVEIVSPRQGG